jgi:hypothetical protein
LWPQTSKAVGFVFEDDSAFEFILAHLFDF